jgi:LysM repeat protein
MLITIFLYFNHFLFFPENYASKITPEQYIENYKDDAIIEMNNYKIPASITLAQGMLESGNGNSTLAVNANNHFGIKCHKDWKGATYIMDDDTKDECFRKYSNVLDSFNDHAKFLTSRSNYTKLFELKITDYKGWAKGLKEAGYATDPKYPKRLIDIIEKYELYRYDRDGKKTKNSQKEISSKPINTEEHKETREIFRLGIKKYIVIKEGDTFDKIAQETDKDLWQLYKYNDLTASDTLIPREKLFLQPKRNKAKEPIHIVQKGETMRSISQMYGIKLKRLYHYNNMKPSQEPKPGDTLFMRKYKKYASKLT